MICLKIIENKYNMINLYKILAGSNSMNKDKIKKTILYISVIIALVLFFFIYKNSSNEVLFNPYDIDIKVNKSLYLNYNPGEVTDVYINVFPTKNKEGNLYDFSSFDITANWDKDNNPKLIQM